MSVQSVVIAFPAVCFSHGVTNYLCKAITGAALWAVYLCMGLCHCHSHSHVGFLLIFNSHIPICPSPPPPNVPPSSAMNSFSRFSLPVTPPSPLHPSHFLSVCLSVSSVHPKCRWSFRRCRNTSCQRRRPQVPLSLLTARGDGCTLVCSAA